VSSAAVFDTTSGDVDVSLATFAVLRLSPGLKAIKTLSWTASRHENFCSRLLTISIKD
jgi:hypothetical protein